MSNTHIFSKKNLINNFYIKYDLLYQIEHTADV